MPKKALSTVSIVLLLVAFLAAPSFAKVDITGTWVGSTEIPDTGPDEFTLVITREDGALAGKMSDEFGLIEDVECEEIMLDNDNLSFHIEFFNGMDYVTVNLRFKVTENALEGEWEAATGETGEINFARKK